MTLYTIFRQAEHSTVNHLYSVSCVHDIIQKVRSLISEEYECGLKSGVICIYDKHHIMWSYCCVITKN